MLTNAQLQAIKSVMTACQVSQPDAFRIVLACRDSDSGTPKMRPRMGSLRQAAEIMQVHPRTLARYAQRGLLHAVKYSCRRVRFDLNEVERFAREGGAK